VAAAERDAVVGVVDFAGLPVVVVVGDSAEPFGFGRVVLVVGDDDLEGGDPGAVVVVVADSAEVFDFGRVVVVVVDDDFDDELDPDGLVVVVVVEEDFEADGLVVVVVVEADFEADGLVVVVVVVDFDVDVEDLPDDLDVVVVVADFPVVEVVAAAGTLGSSLAVDSSRAWLGPAPGTGGDTAGGGIFSSRRAYCMMRANTGADTWPP
jgi:hypothetical protein